MDFSRVVVTVSSSSSLEKLSTEESYGWGLKVCLFDKDERYSRAIDVKADIGEIRGRTKGGA